MISRNKAKMDEKVNQLKEKYSNIEVLAIQCDFSQLSTMQEYRQLIEDNNLENLDIAILCPNAGVVGHTGCIDLMED